MATVLVSSCLLGCKVRYNGSDLMAHNAAFRTLTTQHNIVPFCPEVSAGLPIPRAPAEVQSGDGINVLNGGSKILTDDHDDVTAEFIQGAKLALERCLSERIQFAVLTESSPSCGSQTIYDGTFTGIKHKGVGVTTALLEKNGIRVFSQHNVDELNCLLFQEQP